MKFFRAVNADTAKSSLTNPFEAVIATLNKSNTTEETIAAHR